MKVTLIGGVINSGRTYRVMYCPTCEDCRFHAIDFQEVKRSERGVHVWFRRRCLGYAPVNFRNPNFTKRHKDCCRAEDSKLSVHQWKFFMSDYY